MTLPCRPLACKAAFKLSLKIYDNWVRFVPPSGEAMHLGDSPTLGTLTTTT
jgi:hypothetical protein